MTKKLLLLGDSHSVAIAHGLRKNGFEVVGGQLPLGAKWHLDFHNGGSPLSMSRPEAQAVLSKFIEDAGYGTVPIDQVDAPLVLSLTAIETILYHWTWATHLPLRSENRFYLSENELDTIMTSHYEQILNFCQRLKAPCVNVVSPAPRTADNRRGDLFLRLRDWLLDALKETGVVPVDVTVETATAEGALQQAFWLDRPEDRIHGNEAWGMIAAQGVINALREIESSPKHAE